MTVRDFLADINGSVYWVAQNERFEPIYSLRVYKVAISP
jgi:hypothetical protein